jgi:hypothetical protein
MAHRSLKDRFEALYAKSRPFGLVPTLFQQHKTTIGSYLHDRISLHKTLLLCKACQRRLWPKRFNYIEMTLYHAEGICDGHGSPWCQGEGSAALWLWEGSEQIAERTRAAVCEAVRTREIAMGQRI